MIQKRLPIALVLLAMIAGGNACAQSAGQPTLPQCQAGRESAIKQIDGFYDRLYGLSMSISVEGGSASDRAALREMVTAMNAAARCLGPSEPVQATVSAWTALDHYLSGRRAESISALAQSLQYDVAPSPSLTSAYELLGTHLLFDEQDFATARRVQERLVGDIERQSRSPQGAVEECSQDDVYSSYLTAMHRLALALFALGERDRAERQTRRLHACYRTLLQMPGYPPSTFEKYAFSLARLISLLEARGADQEASTERKRLKLVLNAVKGTRLPEAEDAIFHEFSDRVDAGAYATAEYLGKQWLDIMRKRRGRSDAQTLLFASRLAGVRLRLGQPAQAEAGHQEVLRLAKEAFGLSTFEITENAGLALVHAVRGRAGAALEAARRAEAVTTRGNVRPALLASVDLAMAVALTTSGRFAEATASFKRYLSRGAGNVLGHDRLYGTAAVRAFVGASEKMEPGARQATLEEAFGLIQEISANDAANALSMAAARKVLADAKLSDAAQAYENARFRLKLRERRFFDETAYSVAYDYYDQVLADMIADPVAAEIGYINVDRKTRLNANQSPDARLRADAARQEAELSAKAPEYFALSRATRVSLADLRDRLGPDDAAVFYLLGPLGGSAIAASRQGIAGALTENDDAIAKQIARLRLGLTRNDRGGGNEPGLASGRFDVELASALFDKLLAAPLRGVPAKGRLFVAPDGPLTALPFHLLVTERPPKYQANPDYGATAWLFKSHTVVLVPSAAALTAKSRPSRSTNDVGPSFAGFGDPLVGVSGTLPCDQRPGSRIPYQPADEPAASPPGRVERYRFDQDGLIVANPALLRRMPRLLDAACQIDALEAFFKSTPDAIFKAERFTEKNIKQMSESGALSRYSILAFATHGLISGRSGYPEAGLVLTPPANPSREDDGLLTASEIAGLRLDADLVILSACNTARGDAPGADTLSGLTRAFYFAGARSLMVSHWEVDAKAAVELLQAMVEALGSRRQTTFDEALGVAMTALSKSTGFTSHPSFWGPFLMTGHLSSVQRLQ